MLFVFSKASFFGGEEGDSILPGLIIRQIHNVKTSRTASSHWSLAIVTFHLSFYTYDLLSPLINNQSGNFNRLLSLCFKNVFFVKSFIFFGKFYITGLTDTKFIMCKQIECRVQSFICPLEIINFFHFAFILMVILVTQNQFGN